MCTLVWRESIHTNAILHLVQSNPMSICLEASSLILLLQTIKVRSFFKISDQNTYPIMSDFRPHHLELVGDEDTQESATIYQLRASMNKKLSPQSSQESSSPEAAQELRNLLRRLVEIDVESRELLKRVSSLLEKDERLEDYMKERIEDPKVSRMWQLIEQVLACQEQEHSNLDELVAKGGTGNPSATDKALKGNAIAGTKPDRFKVKNLISNGGEEGTKTTGAPTTTTTTTSDEKSKGN